MRFTLYANKGQDLAKELENLSDLDDVVILDRFRDMLLLIETTKTDAEKLQNLLPSWIVEEERIYTQCCPNDHEIESDDKNDF